MAELIRLRVPRYDLDVDIETLSDLAPNTAAALVAAMPAVGLVTGESTYGSVLCLRLPNFPSSLPPENATIFPVPGDVLVFEREHGVELVIFYERMGGVPAGVPFDACGAKAGNRVGFISRALTSATRAAARRVWSDGAAWGAVGLAGSTSIQSVADDREAADREIERRLATWRQLTWRDHIGAPPGGSRRVALIVPEYDARAEIDLDLAAAPRSGEEIWRHLPVETTLMHGRYSGPEMFTQVGGKEWHWIPERENPTEHPIPGDLVLYFGPPPRLQINYFYGRGAIPYGTPNPEVGNLVGCSVGDFSAFADGCWRIGYEGWKTLIVERVE